MPWDLTPDVQQACAANEKNAPVNGQPVPAGFPLPKPKGEGVTTDKSVSGISSFFGGPFGGAGSAFALTFEFGDQNPTPTESSGGMHPEFGATNGWNPCDNFFAAMNFGNDGDGVIYPDYFAFGNAEASRYYEPFKDNPAGYQQNYITSRTPIYNRKLLVCSESARVTPAPTCSQGSVAAGVVVRAVDNGPAQVGRLIDLSPGASGTLAAITQIAPSGAFAPMDCANWDGGSDQSLTTESNCQFDDGFATNVLVQWADPGSTIGPCGAITTTPPGGSPVTQTFPACKAASYGKAK